jgi:hypothetical protein
MLDIASKGNRWLNNFCHYKVFNKKIPGCMTYVVHPVIVHSNYVDDVRKWLPQVGVVD